MANLQDTKSNEKLAVTRAEIQKKQRVVHVEVAVEAATSKSTKSQKDAKAKLESFADAENMFGRDMIAELEGRAPRGSSSLKPKSAFPGETPAEFVIRLAKSSTLRSMTNVRSMVETRQKLKLDAKQGKRPKRSANNKLMGRGLLLYEHESLARRTSHMIRRSLQRDWL